MIRRAKFLFAAVVAVCMMGFATASLASAAEMILPEWKTAENATSSSKEGSLKIEGGASILCEKNTGKFSTAASKKLGSYTIDFTTCTQGGEPCLSLGLTAGLIEVKGEWHLVLEEKAGTHLWLIWFLLPAVDPHIECLKSAVKLFLVLGSLLGLIEPAHKVAKEFKIILT